MEIIGITGKSGSRKTTFNSLLSKKLARNMLNLVVMKDEIENIRNSISI